MGAVMKMDGSPLDQRKLPHNIEAEQAVIGGLLHENDWYAKAAQIVSSSDFYDPIHQEIFAIIADLIEGGRVATPISLKPYVEELRIGDLGGFGYMMMVWEQGPKKVSSVIECARIVKDEALKRAVYLSCEEMMGRILEYRREDSGPKLLDDMETVIAGVRPNRAGETGFVSFGTAADRAVEIAARAYERGAVLAGMSTGLANLDHALGGLQQTDLIIAAGRPAMGKSALATNIAFAVARGIKERMAAGEKPGVVGVFSMEMSDDQVASRILAEQSRISGWRLRQGRVSEAEFGAFASAAQEMHDLPIETDATSGLSISQIAMRARQLAKRRGLALLIVDYLQLIQGGARKRENRTQELTEITAGLKGLAKELEIPIIALAQVGRDVEKRDDKRPKLSDLRESGSIEQDADIVLFLYRDEYYLKQAEPKQGTEAHNDWTLAMERAHGRGEIIISKNRHGPTTTIHVGYDATLTRFTNEVPDDVRLPERDGRAKQERPKKLALIKEATIALGILKNLLITSSIENDGHVDKAANGMKLVPYTLWREKCAEELLDSDRGEKAAATLMEKIVKDLRAPASGHPSLIGRGGSKETPFVWVIEVKN